MATSLVQTVNELRWAVSGNPATTKDKYTDDWYIRRINAAILEVIWTFEIPDYEKTTTAIQLLDGNGEYDFTAITPQIEFILSIKNLTTGTILESETIDRIEEWDEDERGEPICFIRYGYSIIVRPIPSETYSLNYLRVRYISKYIPMTSPNDLDNPIPVPEEFYRLVFQYALALSYADNNEIERAGQAMAIYLGMRNGRKDLRSREIVAHKVQLK